MKTRILLHTLLGTAAVVTLAACGGGSSDAAPAPATAAPQQRTVELAPETPAAPPAAPARQQPEGELNATKVWDFTEGEERLATWRFVDRRVAAHPDGALITLTQPSGPVAQKRDFRMDADRYHVVRVRASLANGEPLERVRFFWVRATEVERRGDGWPFAEQRMVVLRRDADDPTLWQGNLWAHPRWEEEMEGYFVEFSIDEELLAGEEPVQAVLGEVTLLTYEQG